jgi:hypothetical protein
LRHDQHDEDCEGLKIFSPEELRAAKLSALDVGDIVGARRTNGNILPFLVTRADDRSIAVRAITSQFPLVFDRANGEASDASDGKTATWRIVSMQPLPVEYHTLMLSLDRRMRLGANQQINPLDDGDKRALLYLGEHWAAFPI